MQEVLQSELSASSGGACETVEDEPGNQSHGASGTTLSALTVAGADGSPKAERHGL